ncbi:pyridoxal phosphate-dependent decarboxylase family protein [Aliiglaciecola sp. M165]|uniref:pyridoxal phosphate-dependent decarboxylase family protein n=1 Tax=Aliiglaciecola sp. M165 TaxID=2593649 RepID=UPI001180BBC0|nr:aminotransferase class V-fold PLP-dependent enzyme [Aliiglaciecola sp. M165]TRY31054.1 aminotransferase class V-fold PLP-dependent enzyme [Aliiglaciecola sp. M165]
MASLQQQLFVQKKSKKLLNQASDLALEYLETIENSPVVPSRTGIEMLKEFDIDLPDSIGDEQQILEQLASIGCHNTVHYNGGRYYGFVNGGILPIGMATRWLADVWDQNAALNVMSPIAAKLESVCEVWLKQLFNLPEKTVAGLVGGTSVASLCGLAAARYRQLQNLNWDLAQNGTFGAPKLRIIMGTQTHGTVVKMLNLLGFGAADIEWVECDDQGRMIPDLMPALDRTCIVVLQAGNVCSGAFDHFSQLIPKAKQAQAWVHVDGAFGLWAAASPRFSHLTKDVNLADSWSVDGHKTLNTPYDCGVILCADEQALTHALHQQGSYIQSSEERDSMMFTPDMSRRAKGIDLWSCLRYLGRQGIAELIELLHERASYFALQASQIGFKVLNDVVFNQVILQADTEQQTLNTLKKIQASGVCWCGGAKWQGKAIIRVSICAWATTEKDIDDSIEVFAQCLNGSAAGLA